MGVRGLQTFLTNNPQLCEDTNLSDTKLVIDANNLLCSMYSNMCLTSSSPNFRCDLYGGNFVDYAELVKLFFKNLEKCKIEPILVSDGSVLGKKAKINELASKDKTVYKRALDKFQRAKLAVENLNNQDNFQLSSIVSTVFRTIVEELGIKLIQLPFEADTYIAQLANQHSCPVLTNDSDFIIYSLPRGFAILNLFDFRSPVQDKNGSYSIKCSLFDQQQLVKCLPGLKEETLPLLSVLLGNDFVEPETFKSVLNNLSKGGRISSLRADTFNHKRIVSLLLSLRHKNLDQAIDSVLNQFPSRDHGKINSILRYFLQSYNTSNVDDLTKELDEVYPDQGTDPPIPPDRPELRPSHYLMSMSRNNIDPAILYIIFHNTQYRYSQVDDLSLPTSTYVEYRVYSVIAALLRPRSYANLTTNMRQLEMEKDGFVNYDRVGHEYRRIVIQPMEELENYGSLEHMDCYSLVVLEPSLKEAIFMATLRFNMDEMNLLTDTLSNVFAKDFLRESVTAFILLKYIGLETGLFPKPEFVDAIMLTLFYYAALNGQLNPSFDLLQAEYGAVLLNLEPHTVTKNGINYEPSESLYRRIVHFINQLKCSYRVYSMLQPLLDTRNTFHVPCIHKFFNAPFIFRLTKLMHLEELTLETLCECLPSLLDASATVRALVNSRQNDIHVVSEQKLS